jgi:Tol biopolymer transport system component
MSSRLFAPLNEATTIANVYGFLIFGRVIIVSIIILSSIFIVVLPLLLPNQSAFATFPGENGKISFTSTRDVSEEIYVMNSDGTNPTKLTNNIDVDEFPSWSSDGTKIAFTSTRDGNSEIYVMNAHDGSNQTRLTNNIDVDEFPDWSTADTEPE